MNRFNPNLLIFFLALAQPILSSEYIKKFKSRYQFSAIK